jgi:hypothetical protein
MDSTDFPSHSRHLQFSPLARSAFLQELIGDKSLEHFRLEYEKLHRALKKCLATQWEFQDPKMEVLYLA